MSRFVTVILALLVFFSCKTAAPAEDPSDTAENNNTEMIPTDTTASESGVFESIRSDIISAIPETLNNAYKEAGSGEAAGTEKGIEYRYIAWKLMKILYPEKYGDLAPVNPPSSSSFPNTFKEVEAGDFINNPAIETNYLSLLLSTLVILYTDDGNIISNALENLDEAYALDPLSPSILYTYLKGKNMEREKKYDEALEFYNDTLEISETMYPARMGLYRIYVLRKQWDNAIVVENILIEELYGKIEFTYYHALRLMGSDEILASYDLTSILLKTEPQNPQFLFLRARQDFHYERYQQVLTVLGRLYSLRYRKEEAYYLLYSRTYRALDQVNDAKKIIKEGLVIYPASEELKNEYGKVLILTGDVDEGSMLITSGSDNAESMREGKEMLLKQAMNKGNWVDAEKLILELLEIKKTESYLMSAAVIYKELGINNKALKYIEDLYSKSSDPAVLPVYIAVLLQAGGNDNKVFKLITDGLDKIKNSKVRSQLYVYKSFFSSVRTERLRNLTYAKLEDPTNVEALILLADYFTEIGDNEQALANLKDAALIEPDNKTIKEKIESIED